MHLPDNMDWGMDVKSCKLSDSALVFTVQLGSDFGAEDCSPANEVIKKSMRGWVSRTPAVKKTIDLAKQYGYAVQFSFKGAKNFSISY